jgi:hypothetical protein
MIQDEKKIAHEDAAGTHDLKEAAEPCPLFNYGRNGLLLCLSAAGSMATL